MLGVALASKILYENHKITPKQFSAKIDQELTAQLIALQAQSKEVTAKEIKKLDGILWDGNIRLPNKWLLLKREYNLSLALDQSFASDIDLFKAQKYLNINKRELVENWVRLELHQNPKYEQNFFILPTQLRNKAIFYTEDFQILANFAQTQDK